MTRLTKILAISIGALAALFAVAAIAFLLFFDPNDFREDVEKAVKESTGRDLTIDGEVSLSLFPWLAVEVGKASLGNAPGFGDEPFAEIESAHLSVRLWPLLIRQEASIGTAKLEGLRLVLVVDEQGGGNWDDLVSETDDEGAGTAGAPEGSSLDISGVDINDAFISYAQLENGETYTLSDANFRLGRISGEGEPVPASGSAHFDMQPAGISGDIELESVVAFDLDEGLVNFNGFSLEGIVEGLAATPTPLAFRTDSIEVQTEKQVVALEPVSFSALGVDVRAEVEQFSYADDIRPIATIDVDAFSPRSVMQTLEVEMPETADPNALDYLLASAVVEVGVTDIVLKNLDIKLDDTTFIGNLVVPMDPDGRYSFDLRGDTIDLNRYMEPPAEGTTESAGDESPPMEIPVDLVKMLSVSGRARLESARLGNLVMEELLVGVQTGRNTMRIHPIEASLYGGSYAGDVRIDASTSTPILTADEAIRGVDLGKLAEAMFEQQNITGTMNGTFKLRGSGNNMADVQRTLNGTLYFELSDGTYEGTDIWYELRKARALLKQETPPDPVLPARTRFSEVSANGVVTDGIMRNDDFVAELPFMQLRGQGEVNIPESTVDYGLTARVYDRPEANEAATPEEIEDFTKTVIPLKITGSLESPKVVPDVEALLRQQVEEEIEDVLKDKLKGLFD